MLDAVVLYYFRRNGILNFSTLIFLHTTSFCVSIDGTQHLNSGSVITLFRNFRSSQVLSNSDGLVLQVMFTFIL